LASRALINRITSSTSVWPVRLRRQARV